MNRASSAQRNSSAASSRRQSSHHHSGTGRKRLNRKILLILAALVVLVAVGLAGFLFRQHRRNPQIYIDKGDALFEAGEYQLARKQYEKAYYYDRQDTATMMRIVKTLLRIETETPAKAAQNAARAIGILRRITQMDPNDMAAQEMLLEMLYEHASTMGQERLLNELLKTATEFVKKNADNMLALRYKALAAIQLMKFKAYDDIEAHIGLADAQAALAEYPDDPELIRNISLWYSLRADQKKRSTTPEVVPEYQEKAESVLADYLKRHPDDLETQILLARTYFQNDRPEPSAQTIKAVEAKLLQGEHPELIPTVVDFILLTDREPTADLDGILYRGGLLRAEQLLREAYRLKPDDIEILVRLALVLKDKGNFDAAAELLTKAFGMKTANVAGAESLKYKVLQTTAGVELANRYVVMAETATDEAERAAYIKKARETVGKLIKEMKSTAVTDLLEGKILMLEGDFGKALSKFESSTRKFNNTNPEPIFLSAIILKRMGEIGAAEERLSVLAAAAKTPGQALRTYSELIDIYLTMNDIDRAEKAVYDLLRKVPDNNQALLLKSEILRRKASTPVQSDVDYFTEAEGMLKNMARSGDMQATSQLARLYYDADRKQEARALLEGAWEAQQKNDPVFQQLIWLDMQMGEKETALERIKQMMAKYPDDRRLQLMQTQVRDENMSAEAVEKFLLDDQESFASALTLYRFYTQRGQTEKAEEAFRKAASLEPNNLQIMAITFEKALEASDWDQASTLARRAAEVNADGAKGMFWQGRLEMAEEQYARAVSTLKLALAERPLFSDGWRLLGDAHRQNNDLLAAERAYQEALKIRPDHLGALYRLFLVHDMRGLYQIALGDLKRALEIAPDNQMVWDRYVSYLGRENPQEALKMRRERAEKYPDNMDNQREIAKLLVLLGQTEEAGKLFDQFLDADSDDFQSIADAAMFSLAQGDVEGGRAILEDYLNTHEDEVTALHWLVLARYLARANLTEPAISTYQKAISMEDPMLMPATRELADWYFQNKYFSLALALYQQAFEKSRSPRLWLRLIDTLIYAEKLDEAQRTLAAYVKENGHDGQSSLLECIIAIGNNDTKRAEEAAARAVSLAPNNPKAYLYRARLNFLKESKAFRMDTINDLTKALSLDPSLTSAREMLAKCYLEAEPQNLPGAVEQLKIILAQEPRYMPARLQLAEIYDMQGEKKVLTAFIDESINMFPLMGIWYRMRAQTNIAEGQPEKALEDLQRSFDLDREMQTLALLGQTLIAAGRPEAAVELFQKWSYDANQVPLLQIIYAGALSASGKPEEAGEAFDKTMQAILDTAPQRVDAVLQEARKSFSLQQLTDLTKGWVEGDSTGAIAYATGRMLLAENEVNEALMRLETAHRKLPATDPRRIHALHMLANAYQILHRYEQSAETYERILAVNDKDHIALNNCAYLYAEYVPNPEKAVKYAEMAVRNAPNDAEIRAMFMDTLGWAQYKAGQLDQARISLMQSIRNAPNSVQGRYHLAQVLFAKGMDREGRLEIRQLLQVAEQQGDTDMIARANQLLAEQDAKQEEQ
jgi:tetratricopeptide (TPR) repeat protein